VIILHVCRQYLPCRGGVERFVNDLAVRLVQRGHQAQVATLDACFTRPDRKLPHREIVNGVPTARLRYVGGPLAFFAPGVLRLAREADILHIHNTDFFLDYLALTQPVHHKPFVLSTHGGYFHTPAFKWVKTLAFHSLTRFSLSRAAFVIADSAADAARFGPVSRHLRRVENGVDTEAFAGIQKIIEPGRLLYHGRLAANKRCDLLLALLAALRRRGANARLILSGTGRPGELEALQARAATLGVADLVSFEGEVDDRRLRENLARAHLFLSASEYEAFGISVAEALASGTVPVVSDIEAHRELVEDGVSGFLTDFENPVAAAEKVRVALSIPLDRLAVMGEAGRARIRQNDWEQVVPAFEAIYEEALGGSISKA